MSRSSVNGSKPVTTIRLTPLPPPRIRIVSWPREVRSSTPSSRVPLGRGHGEPRFPAAQFARHPEPRPVQRPVVVPAEIPPDRPPPLRPVDGPSPQPRAVPVRRPERPRRYESAARQRPRERRRQGVESAAPQDLLRARPGPAAAPPRSAPPPTLPPPLSAACSPALAGAVPAIVHAIADTSSTPSVRRTPHPFAETESFEVVSIGGELRCDQRGRRELAWFQRLHSARAAARRSGPRPARASGPRSRCPGAPS